MKEMARKLKEEIGCGQTISPTKFGWNEESSHKTAISRKIMPPYEAP